MKKSPKDSSPAVQEQWQRFGALLRERRNAAKLSRVKLARQAKVCDTTIKFTETARHRPSRATLMCLLAIADLHLTWADVPSRHEPPAEKNVIPAASLPSPPSVPVDREVIPAEPLPSPPSVPVDREVIPAAPLSTAPRVPANPSPDPAQFLMDLIGFDEIRLPEGTPKSLRMFQERHRVGGQAGSKFTTDEPNGK